MNPDNIKDMSIENDRLSKSNQRLSSWEGNQGLAHKLHTSLEVNINRGLISYLGGYCWRCHGHKC